jgi:hypothetical protein
VVGNLTELDSIVLIYIALRVLAGSVVDELSRGFHGAG